MGNAEKMTRIKVLSSSTLRAGDEYVFDDKRFRVVGVREYGFNYASEGIDFSRGSESFENAVGMGVREISPGVQVIMVNKRFVRFLASAFYGVR